MTIAELINIADELVENPFSASVKLMLVNGIEGRVQQECLRIPQEEIEVYTAADVADETELLLKPPFEQVYVSWMKAMYYWHMAEYNSYQDEKTMFDNEWTRLCREVAERQACGTSTPPDKSFVIRDRTLVLRNVINEITYDAQAQEYLSERTFSELKDMIDNGVLPVCKHGTDYLALASVNASELIFAMNMHWLDESTQEFAHAHVVLWIRSNGAVEIQYDEI